MAFVRWRGGCSQLIATVYEDGRSRQITLANLPDFYVTESTKNHVTQKFPKISVDWAAVDQELARGLSESLKESTPHKHLDYATVEHYLRQWANEAETTKRSNDAINLRLAADALTRWRAEFYWSSQLGSNNPPQV